MLVFSTLKSTLKSDYRVCFVRNIDEVNRLFRERLKSSTTVDLINMNAKMYIGNFPFDATEQDLRELFTEHGSVTEVFMPTDRESGRPRGFAFVTMDSADSMNAAIAALNGQDFQGRALVVNEARPQEPRDNYRGGGNGGYRGNGGRRNDNGYSRDNRRDNNYSRSYR